MKRIKIIGIMIIVCVAALCTALFAGCKPAKFDTPAGFQYSNETFSWNAVDGADGYMVHINEKSEFYITTTSVSINNVEFGDGLVEDKVNVLYVKAVSLDGDGNVKKESDIAGYEFDYVIPVKKEWTVTFDLNYTGAPQAQTVSVKSGDNFDKPEPKRHGWKFGGWYRDKQCLVIANFTASGVSNFNVTADTTLYAKWSIDESVTTTPVYYYSESWSQVNVKPYNGEAALFSGEGIEMAVVAGKANWFKATIDDKATSVIFTNGEDSTQSTAFDKTKPYCKAGAWTASMPVEQSEEDYEVTIQVGNSAPQQLTKNPAVAGEYMIENIELKVGDKVVITINGKAVSDYDPDCKFKGTAEVEGKYAFYVTEDNIWVEVPKTPEESVSVILTVNGDTENSVPFEKNNPEDPNIAQEYYGTVVLKVGDTVKITEGDFEYKNYDAGCGFNGTATIEGAYTFYAKKYQSGTASVWVAVPANTEVPTTSTKVYYHDNDGWTNVYLYYWLGGTQTNGGAWPGVKMESLGNGWFSLDIQPGYNMVIFNNGAGTQTVDLTLVAVDGVAYYTFNGVTSSRPAESGNVQE